MNPCNVRKTNKENIHISNPVNVEDLANIISSLSECSSLETQVNIETAMNQSIALKNEVWLDICLPHSRSTCSDIVGKLNDFRFDFKIQEMFTICLPLELHLPLWQLYSFITEISWLDKNNGDLKEIAYKELVSAMLFYERLFAIEPEFKLTTKHFRASTAHVIKALNDLVKSVRPQPPMKTVN